MLATVAYILSVALAALFAAVGLWPLVALCVLVSLWTVIHAGNIRTTSPSRG